MTILTCEELKKVLSYDPETGVFTWLVRNSTRTHVGLQAGSINRYGGVSIGLNNEVYQAHRLAYLYMIGEWPRGFIRHRNKVKSDNRWLNLWYDPYMAELDM